MGDFLTRRLMGCGILLLMAILLSVGVAIYQGLVSNMHASAAAPYKAQMAAYFAPPKGGPDATGPVKGKMIVLDRAAQEIDWDASYALPGDLKAAQPAEVGAVVWLEYGRIPGGLVYGTDRIPSFIQTCKITVIDQASWAVVATTTVQGGSPPKNIGKYDKEGVGSKPTTEVVAYLKGLPRK